jgi:hypothetical protein
VNEVMRMRCLRYAVGFVGLLFTAMIYPLVIGFGSSGGRWQISQDEQMLLGVYVTLGIFLLIASRNPLRYRTLIWFAVWSSVAHAAVMSVQAINASADRGDLLGGSVIMVLVAILLAVWAPRGSVTEAGGDGRV